ncbi:uncharacterized protein LOC144075018 isoform X3 [Stigmatopora argus]
MDMGRQEAGAPKNDGLRFNSLVLRELSEEFEKCTQETQRLQGEVEQATKATLEKFGKRTSVPSCNDCGRQQGQSDTQSRTRKKILDTALHFQFSPTQKHKHIQMERVSTSNLRMEELFTSVGQEVAMLNRKLSSSKKSGVRINDKLELLRKRLQQKLSPGGDQQRARTDDTCRKTCREERDQLVEILMRQLEKSNQTICRLHQQNALFERCSVTPENVDQRPYQSIQSQHQAQELALVRKEKSQLACQLDAIRSKDKHLRERIGQLEATFHKMSEGLTNCQDFIQLKEQEFLRLQLKHILDLTEFQGANETPPGLDSAILEPDDLGPSKQKNHGQNLPGAHVNCDTLQRRSFPERTHRPAFEEAKVARRRTTCGSDTTDSLHSGLFGSCPMTVKRNTFYTRRPQTSGRGSPVYVLLTSEPGHT